MCKCNSLVKKITFSVNQELRHPSPLGCLNNVYLRTYKYKKYSKWWLLISMPWILCVSTDCSHLRSVSASTWAHAVLTQLNSHDLLTIFYKISFLSNPTKWNKTWWSGKSIYWTSSIEPDTETQQKHDQPRKMNSSLNNSHHKYSLLV